jgi:hypothetical protein
MKIEKKKVLLISTHVDEKKSLYILSNEENNVLNTDYTPYTMTMREETEENI